MSVDTLRNVGSKNVCSNWSLSARFHRLGIPSSLTPGLWIIGIIPFLILGSIQFGEIRASNKTAASAINQTKNADFSFSFAYSVVRTGLTPRHNGGGAFKNDRPGVWH